MAAVGGVCCGGNVHLQRQEPSFNSHNPNRRPCSFTVKNQRTPTKISSSKLTLQQQQPSLKQQEQEKNKRNESVYDKIDEWMRDSVVDIVKKLPGSPLLVRVYSDSDDNTTRLKTERAHESDWVSVKEKWEKGESPMPDGLIFVEQIEQDDYDDGGEKNQNEDVSRAWGIVVQGKGRGLAPACYLLKTSKVSSGLGLKCTHFCLVKVKSFRETAFSQLKNCWLLQGN